jgi:hypothetical protein
MLSKNGQNKFQKTFNYKTMNANDIKFRCSSLGHVMSNAKDKSDISETCKTHLIDVFISHKYGRNTDISNKYTAKGLLVEEDSLTLYSRFKQEFYLKNEALFENEFIKGTPDIILENTIIDIKSSYDIYTFFRTKFKSIHKLYYWQLQGYMYLTGKQNAKLAYCLTDTPDVLVTDEKRRLQWKMNVIDDVDPVFQEACTEIEKLAVYDDIPMEDRVIEIDIPRNETDIQLIGEKVAKCRNWMNENLYKI